MLKVKTISETDLEEAYIIMAKIVQKYGDKYLPVFQRIHQERETLKAKQDLRSIALQVAQNTLR